MKSREQRHMNRKFGKLREFEFLRSHLEMFCLSVQLLALSDSCKIPSFKPSIQTILIMCTFWGLENIGEL